MFGGDEVAAVVVDMGSGTTKVGFAGEDTPKAVVPSFVGAGEAGSVVGGAALCSAKDGVELTPVMQHGVVTDWAAAEELLRYALVEQLQVDMADHPVLFSEPVFNSRDSREKLAEIAFETFGVPAFFVAKDAVLSAYACGKPSGIVLSSGAQVTVASVVSDGYVLNSSVVRNHAVGGESINRGILSVLGAAGISVVARHGFSLDDAGTAAYADAPGVTHSFDLFTRMAIVDDIRHTMCAVAPVGNYASVASLAPMPYELPDRTVFEWGAERYMVPEAMFRPAWMYKDNFADAGGATGMDVVGSAAGASGAAIPMPPPLATADTVVSKAWQSKTPAKFNTTDPIPVELGARDDSLGVHEMIYRAGATADIDLRRDLFGSVIVCGGNTLYDGFADRVKAELALLLPASYKLKMAAFNSPTERRFAPWIGGSILASLGSAHSLWISKQEYAEHGRSLVHKKCP